ncbi:MAG: methionyl-tRNA formyltransferase [Dehalococcoidia bacterium]|nr:methionyl-tRNA formyltransferase [Dehalococcoidia bacterium]
MRVIFMGTSQLSVTILEALVGAGYEIVQVYTRADKPAGRGRQPTPPPVKEAALRLGLPIYQPTTLRTPAEVERLQQLRPDLIVLAAYGRLIPPEILAIPPLACLNVHPSLLPRYRGPSPITAPILAGDKETGVTIFVLDENMDTGPILAQRSIPISPEDTGESLSDKLARLGAQLLLDTIPLWAKGEIRPQPQDHSQATYTHILKKEEGKLDWSQPAVDLWRQVRAFQPWPGAYTTCKGQILKVLACQPILSPVEGEQGSVLLVPDPKDAGKRLPAVQTGQGLLVLRRLQLEGRRPLEAHVFLQGVRDFVGSRLDDPS